MRPPSHDTITRSTPALNGYGLGRCYEALNKVEQALTSYAAADRLRSKLLDGVPLTEGLVSFLHDREEAVTRSIGLLVKVGRNSEALQQARRARARLMTAVSHANRVSRLDPSSRSKWEQAIAEYRREHLALERAASSRWTLPANHLAEFDASAAATRQRALDALDRAHAVLQREDVAEAQTAPDRGTALLALFPAADGYVAFVASGADVAATLLGAVDDARLPEALTPILTAALRQATAVERVDVILHPSLNWIDVHAAVVSGQPLLAHIPVAYRLDAPMPPARALDGGGALIVADPTADLPAALREGEAAAEALGIGPAQLLRRKEAKRDAVLAMLPHATRFHYAGHAQIAGSDGIESGLRLSDGWLALGDVITLPSAPELVVLSACESINSKPPQAGGGFGVAEAFIAAGARTVVAATRPVRDESARAVFAQFYRALAAEPKLDAATALRAAQLRLRSDLPAADWSAFRVLVP